MSKKIWWLVACAILIVVLLPLGIDWLIIGNDFPSNISNSEWVGFFGGYIGAIIGAIVSLVGIIVTIRFTKAQIDASHAQYEDEKRMNYIPILDCKILEVIEGLEDGAIRMDVEYTLNNKEKLLPMTIAFEIWNIGVGAATDINYGMEIEESKQDGVFWLPGKRIIRSQDCITQKITIYIPPNKEFAPTIVVNYEDVLGNKYRKSIEIVMMYNNELDEMHFCILKQDKGELCSTRNEEKLYYVIEAAELRKACKVSDHSQKQ